MEQLVEYAFRPPPRRDWERVSLPAAPALSPGRTVVASAGAPIKDFLFVYYIPVKLVNASCFGFQSHVF